MRRLTILMFFALTLRAQDRSQSYISYDNGGTIVREDDTVVGPARVNLPVYPNDVIITDQGGRAEVRLADGNVMGIDRGTTVGLFSVLNSWEGHSDDTILELRSGKIMLYRTHDARDTPVRANDFYHWVCVSTTITKYCAEVEAFFTVQTDGKGNDRVEVFDGKIEVRKSCPAARMRAGERARVDRIGLSDLKSDDRERPGDFENWFLQRPWRFGRQDLLAGYGSWTEIPDYGNVWRPHGVGADWRPYFDGSWRLSRYGYLSWVPDEPWGWLPSHYGRWMYEPAYGWFWMQGTRYSPAWVYWWYGPGYIGWAPAGWYDVDPAKLYPVFVSEMNIHAAIDGINHKLSPWVRVDASEIDLFPWTFVESKLIATTRVDRAVVAIEPDGVAVIGTKPGRFGRSELQDATAMGGAIKSLPDQTKFFRRDGWGAPPAWRR